VKLHATHIRPLVTAILVLTLGFVVPRGAVAEPSTPEIEAKKAEAAQAQAHLMDLAAQLELRTEEYYAITAQLQETRDSIAQTRAELERADRELSRATDLLERRAAGIYRGGNVDLIEVLLGTTSFQDFLSRMDWLQRIGRNDAALIASVKDVRERVRETEAVLERREQEQATLRAQAQVKQEQVEQAVADQETYVSTLNAEVAQLVAAEEERLRQLAEERARQAAAEAARRAAAAVSSRTDPLPSDPGSLGAGHPEAVDVGLRYLGVPYVWGGSSPSGFDCSGLTQYVYREIGISIPRTSREQFRSGSHVASDRLDLLVPGDLVFFGYGGDPGMVHHVGIYAGDGNYLHAPYTGASVRVDSLLDRIAASGDYVGASRF